MNRIVYFSTAMVPNDFNELINSSGNKPNPSNQIFHTKMIHALSLYNEIEVIVNRPLKKSSSVFSNVPYEKKKVGNVTYHYIGFTNHQFLKPSTFRNRAGVVLSKLLAERKETVFLVDSLNVTLAKLAHVSAKLHKVKNFGIITDNPANLSGIQKKYLVAVTKTFANYDGFLTLTEGLNSYSNPQGKPHYTFPGLVEESKTTKMLSERKFFFFGGALYERYGILNLLQAFRSFTGDYDLIIAGQGPEVHAVRDAAKSDSRIVYGGMLSPTEVLKFQKNASLNINPRPNNEELDRLSIPSKVLDYMASGVPTLSVKNDELYSLAGETLLWAPTGSPEDLLMCFDRFQNMTEEEKQKLALAAKNRVFERCSIDTQGSKISYFIKSNK